jgi:hypothetical protein
VQPQALAQFLLAVSDGRGKGAGRVALGKQGAASDPVLLAAVGKRGILAVKKRVVVGRGVG